MLAHHIVGPFRKQDISSAGILLVCAIISWLFTSWSKGHQAEEMLAKPKRETTHWKTLSTVISIHNLCGFSIHSKCIGTVSSISSEDNAPLFFVALVFFKAGVYSRISSVSAMHGIAQFVLCDFSQQHFFFIFDFYLKNKLFKNMRGAVSVVQFFFTCQNLSKIILLT